MTPILFGPANRRLYGVYETGGHGTTCDEGVVICPPFGQEYMRAHKALRHLSAQLSRRGVPALRFDYFGSGDSSGHGCSATVDSWTADIVEAMGEVRRLSGSPKIALIGLRFGAALAARVASTRLDVHSLVLWDPIVSGRDYVADLCRIAVHPDGSRRPFVGIPEGDVVASVKGFPLTAEMRRGMDEVETKACRPNSRRVLLIVSSQQPAYRMLSSTLAAGHVCVQDVLVEGPSSWDSASSAAGDLVAGNMVLPQRLIGSIVSWVHETPRHD